VGRGCATSAGPPSAPPLTDHFLRCHPRCHTLLKKYLEEQIVVSIDHGKSRHLSAEMQANRVSCPEITAKRQDLGETRHA
jgi:hypothetical protein